MVWRLYTLDDLCSSPALFKNKAVLSKQSLSMQNDDFFVNRRSFRSFQSSFILIFLNRTFPPTRSSFRVS